jgi:hypothetical protein
MPFDDVLTGFLELGGAHLGIGRLTPSRGGELRRSDFDFDSGLPDVQIGLRGCGTVPALRHCPRDGTVNGETDRRAALIRARGRSHPQVHTLARAILSGLTACN